jgi:type II secretory pathway component PulF
LYYFHKKLKINKKNKKTQKTPFLLGFLGGFLGFFWVGFLLPTLAEGQIHVLLRAHQPADALRQHHVPQDGAPVLTR